jgi:hypothetical protein
VSQSGVVTGVSFGTATITASAEGKTGTASVTGHSGSSRYRHGGAANSEYLDNSDGDVDRHDEGRCREHTQRPRRFLDLE